MTNVQKNEIRESVIGFLQTKGISQSDLATRTSISNATISKIINGKWESIDDRIWLQLKNYVTAIVREGLFTTSDFSSVVNLCDKARKHRFMIGLLADTGMGKTTALEAYSHKRNVYYVSYDKTMKPKQFFIALLKEMGIAFEGSIHQLVNRIAEELNTRASPLLIIDEAGKITHTMILYLHVLRDKTIKNCGIVLAGMPYFKTNLIKFSNKEKEGYAEFYRRVNIWHSLSGLSRKEVMQILVANGIQDENIHRELQHKKRFGDLANEIYLLNSLNE